MNSNLAYQEDRWQELINGRIFMMSPRPSYFHNQVSFNIARMFANYLSGKRCTAIADGTTLFLSETNHFVPDFMLVCDPEKLKADGVHGAPDIVAEVLSPGTVKNDRGPKMKAYESAGVKEYWLVNPIDKTVEQYLLQDGRLVFAEAYTVFPDYALQAMSDEERASVITEFKCSLYDDFNIQLADVFERLP